MSFGIFLGRYLLYLTLKMIQFFAVELTILLSASSKQRKFLHIATKTIDDSVVTQLLKHLILGVSPTKLE